MTEAEPVVENFAVVLVWGGAEMMLYWLVDEPLSEYLESNGVGVMTACTGIETPPLVDGLWIGRLWLVDDGPGDWPGSRESIAQFFDEKILTRKQMDALRVGEHPEFE